MPSYWATSPPCTYDREVTAASVPCMNAATPIIAITSFLIDLFLVLFLKPQIQRCRTYLTNIIVPIGGTSIFILW